MPTKAEITADLKMRGVPLSDSALMDHKKAELERMQRLVSVRCKMDDKGLWCRFGRVLDDQGLADAEAEMALWDLGFVCLRGRVGSADVWRHRTLAPGGVGFKDALQLARKA